MRQASEAARRELDVLPLLVGCTEDRAAKSSKGHPKKRKEKENGKANNGIGNTEKDGWRIWP